MAKRKRKRPTYRELRRYEIAPATNPSRREVTCRVCGETVIYNPTFKSSISLHTNPATGERCTGKKKRVLGKSAGAPLLAEVTEEFSRASVKEDEGEPQKKSRRKSVYTIYTGGFESNRRRH